MRIKNNGKRRRMMKVGRKIGEKWDRAGLVGRTEDGKLLPKPKTGPRSTYKKPFKPSSKKRRNRGYVREVGWDEKRPLRGRWVIPKVAKEVAA